MKDGIKIKTKKYLKKDTAYLVLPIKEEKAQYMTLNKTDRKTYMIRKLAYCRRELTQSEIIDFIRYEDDLRANGYMKDIARVSEAVRQYITQEMANSL